MKSYVHNLRCYNCGIELFLGEYITKTKKYLENSTWNENGTWNEFAVFYCKDGLGCAKRQISKHNY